MYILERTEEKKLLVCKDTVVRPFIWRVDSPVVSVPTDWYQWNWFSRKTIPSKLILLNVVYSFLNFMTSVFFIDLGKCMWQEGIFGESFIRRFWKLIKLSSECVCEEERIQTYPSWNAFFLFLETKRKLIYGTVSRKYISEDVYPFVIKLYLFPRDTFTVHWRIHLVDSIILLVWL